MKWSQWFRWFAVVVVAAVVVAATGAVVVWGLDADPFESGAFRVVAGLIGGAMVIWAGYGQFQVIGGEQRSWVKWVQAAVATLILYAAMGCVAVAFVGRGALTTDFMKAAGGVLLIGWAFALALALARLLLRNGPGFLGVARTVLDEAIRMKVALVFIALLLLVLPVLPFVIGGDNPLRYRVQTFLSWSMAATGFLLSLMTIFLACGTLSREIEDKQIFMLAVKPIGRTTFLLGKWLGIVVLDAVLLGVAAVAIYLFTMFYLVHLPAQDAYDAAALREEVLTARVAIQPQPAYPLKDRVERRLEELVNQSPQVILELGQQAALSNNITGASEAMLMEAGKQQARLQLREEAGKQWLSVGPRGSETYLFLGLETVKAKWDEVAEAWRARVEAAEAAGRQPPPPLEPQYVQLRYQAQVAEPLIDHKVQVLLALNGRRKPVELTTGSFQVIPVPVEFIDEEGRLELTIVNVLPENPTIAFKPMVGLEILYRADNFGSNFARAMLMIWVKLAFLAMLGLMAATFLGFPVACTLSLLIFFIAVASGFLLEAVENFGSGEGAVGLVQQGVRYISYYVATFLQKYAQFNPTAQIVDGRLFSWSEVLRGVFWIGVVWTALVGAIAAAIFRGRELARVQV